jgi:hypothetical protein
MSSQTLDDEKPLDPAVERVQRRLRRLIMISGLTLGLGLVAVAVAIFYRLGTAGGAAPAVSSISVNAALPAGSTLVSSTVDGGRIILTYSHPGGTTLFLVDGRTLTVARRLDLKAENAP